MGTQLAIALTVAATLALLVAEWRGATWALWLTKPLASAGFVLTAWSLAPRGAYAHCLLAGLLACWLGDVLLIAARQATFLAGVGAFALGHALYCAAFLQRGVALSVALTSAVVLCVGTLRVWRWLRPHLPAELVGAVAGYMAIITAMVACAAGSSALHGQWRLLLGASMFFVSDLAVARDKFVHPGFANRVWGLPLYYAAQLVLALTLS